MKKEDNLHKEHRERVKARFLKHGFETFDEHVILETVLFFVIPIKDTNLTAHRLINKFGDICGVLEASYDELVSVEGIGKASATYLLMLGALYRIITEKKNMIQADALSVDSVGNFAAQRLMYEKKECTLLVFIKNKRIVDTKLMTVGDKRRTMFDSSEMIRRALELSCDMIAIAHNHPGGSLTPSVDDYRTLYTTNTLTENMNIRLFEYYIVKDGIYYPMLLNSEHELEKIPKES